MKILTTSDLGHVSGGDDDGGSCGPSWSDADSAAYANGISYTLTNPEAAAAATYLTWIFNNSQNPLGGSPTYYNGMGDFYSPQ
jgi:hypothetical protein